MQGMAWEGLNIVDFKFLGTGIIDWHMYYSSGKIH